MGTAIAIAAVISGSIIAFIALQKLTQRRRERKRLLKQPLSEAQRSILEHRFTIFKKLPPPLKSKLEGLTNVFLHEKYFEACGGIETITEEIRVLVAAQACLLLLGLEKHKFFPRLRSILIYPGAYRDRGKRTFDLHEDDDIVRLGESWNSGSVVLSWENVIAGAARDDDGMNVVYHEFAHQLDQIDSSADGAPPLHHRGDYSEWARVFQREYEALVEADNKGKKTLLDPYGATNPAEFFAVATESFFEESDDLKEAHPELYSQLSNYYGLDPVSWK